MSLVRYHKKLTRRERRKTKEMQSKNPQFLVATCNLINAIIGAAVVGTSVHPML
jgi:hypothetical protein